MSISLMVDINGLNLTQDDCDILQHPSVMGVILFSRNYESVDQLKDLVRSIRSLRHPFLIAVDQEGGRVQRFIQGFTRLPSLGELGAQYIKEPAKALGSAYNAGLTMSQELFAVDIDFSFAPVLDLDLGLNQIIGDRSFGSEPRSVISLARAYLRGMSAIGMAAVGKHFPGHGSVKEDTHVASAIDERSYTKIYVRDMQPFIELLPLLSGIMPSHVVYSAVDTQPAGFSNCWLSTVLREYLGFKGAIISDDLSMSGAAESGTIVDRVMMASQAGCDMVLVCNDRSAVVQAIEAFPDSPDQAIKQRLLPFYKNNNVLAPSSY